MSRGLKIRKHPALAGETIGWLFRYKGSVLISKYKGKTHRLNNQDRRVKVINITPNFVHNGDK